MPTFRKATRVNIVVRSKMGLGWFRKKQILSHSFCRKTQITFFVLGICYKFFNTLQNQLLVTSSLMKLWRDLHAKIERKERYLNFQKMRNLHESVEKKYFLPIPFTSFWVKMLFIIVILVIFLNRTSIPTCRTHKKVRIAEI